MTLLTLDFPLTIQRSRLAWAAQLDGDFEPGGRLLTPAVMHSSSRTALMLLPHHHPRPEQLWTRITPQDACGLGLAQPNRTTVERLDRGLRGVLDAHEGLHVTRANRAVVATAHAARAHLFWLCELPAAAVLAAQDALSLAPQDRHAREISRRVSNGIKPRWRVALDAVEAPIPTQLGTRRAS